MGTHPNLPKRLLHDENYRSFIASLLVHKVGGGERGTFLKFWPIGGVLIQRGCLFEGGEGGKVLIGGFMVHGLVERPCYESLTLYQRGHPLQILSETPSKSGCLFLSIN